MRDERRRRSSTRRAPLLVFDHAARRFRRIANSPSIPKPEPDSTIVDGSGAIDAEPKTVPEALAAPNVRYGGDVTAPETRAKFGRELDGGANWVPRIAK